MLCNVMFCDSRTLSASLGAGAREGNLVVVFRLSYIHQVGWYAVVLDKSYTEGKVETLVGEERVFIARIEVTHSLTD
jgi:hypothetical protein